MYHRYLKHEAKPQKPSLRTNTLETGDLMAMVLLMLLLTSGNEECESVVTTLLIFLFL